MVTKSNGSKEPLQIQKIRKMINYVSEGLDVNPLELEANLDGHFKNGIKTSEINEILMLETIKLASVDAPDWIIVGGRILMYNLEREIFKKTGFSYDEAKNTFYEYIQFMVRNGHYKKELGDFSKKEIDRLAKHINPNYDRDYTIGGALSLRKKYLQKRGKAILELPQYSDMVSAMLINRLETDRINHIIEDYKLIGQKVISLATPNKANIRRPGGNTSSCFILEFDDSIESIMKSYQDIAFISKAGGGVGAYLSKVRPSESMLLGQPVANNIAMWVKIINDIAIAVNQAGVRKGAVTPAVDVWHKDIDDFLEIKTEIGEVRLKSFDLFPQIVINNVFIERVQRDEGFWLVDNHEIIDKTGYDLTELSPARFAEVYPEIEAMYESGKLTNGKKIAAKALWKRMLTVYVETGDLYFINRDSLNKHNPVLAADLFIKCANLCTESFSPIKASTEFSSVFKDGKMLNTGNGLTHTCDLVSLNLAKILNDEILLEKASRRSVRILDNTMDVTTVPVAEGANNNDFFRTVGVGTLGTADWMAWNRLSYQKEEDWDKLEALYEKISYYCHLESIEIAAEKGSFEAYELSYFKEGKVLGKTAEELNRDSVAGLDWSVVCEGVKRGMRNMLLLSPAPNTSTAVLMGASASFLPVFSKFNYETMANLAVPVMPKFIAKRFWYYNEGFTVPTEKIIKLTCRLQKWIDTGMSMELIINPEITNIKKISDTMLESFKNGLKSVYYCRVLDMSKKDQDDKTPTPSCISCAN